MVWFLLVRAFTPLGAGLAHRSGRLDIRGDGSGGRSRRALAGLGNLGTGCHGVSRGETASRVLLAPDRSGRRGGDRPLPGMARAELTAPWRSPWLDRWSCSRGFRSARPGERPPNGTDWKGGRRSRRATVPADAWVVAPEALLFQADRRGCRMEWTHAAAARAAGEWGSGTTGRRPARTGRILSPPGGSLFRRPGLPRADLTRKGLHDAVRRRYKVIVDRPEVIIADLADSEMHWNAN